MSMATMPKLDETETGVFGLADLSSSSVEAKTLTPDDELLEAVLGGDLDAACQALANGANIHMRSDSKYTPLMHAVSDGNWQMLKLLLDKGADVADNFGAYNVLMILCDSTCTDDLSLLKCLNLLLEGGANPSTSDWMGATPLIHAVRKNREPLALRLIDTGCSINTPDSEGWTPLFYAVQNNNISIAQLLIDCGAKINLMDPCGRTPFHIAASSNNRELAKMVTTRLKPEASLADSSVISVKKRSQQSAYEAMLEKGPKLNDRLYGFHDEAIKFLRGIGLEYVASSMSTKNLQFAALLTWDETEWSEAGIHLTYHRNKIRTSVRQYHEKEWSNDAVPNLSHVYEDGKIDLFKTVQVLASFLRMTHISSATSLYMLKNYNGGELPADIANNLQEVSMLLAVIRKQIPIIIETCREIEKRKTALPPDLIINRPKYYSKIFRLPLVLACITGAVAVCYLVKNKVLLNLAVKHQKFF